MTSDPSGKKTAVSNERKKSSANSPWFIFQRSLFDVGPEICCSDYAHRDSLYFIQRNRCKSSARYLNPGSPGY